jgi:hypothetical protein
MRKRRQSEDKNIYRSVKGTERNVLGKARSKEEDERGRNEGNKSLKGKEEKER